jgi:hypothetical protein
VVLDMTSHIDRVHLEAALTLWKYCEASARYIFGDVLGDPAADTILRALRAAYPTGMTRSDISGLFGRHLAGNKIESALARLYASKKIRFETHNSTGGRPRETWFAIV